jgi:hypothetical protein
MSVYERVAVIILLMTGMSLGVYTLDQFRQLGAAHADGGLTAIPPPPSDDAKMSPAPSPRPFSDPTEDASGFYGDMQMAKKKGGWLGLILVGLYGLCRVIGYAGQKLKWLAWLNQGKAAMVVAAAATVLSAGCDALFLGGTFATVLVGMLWAAVGLISPAAKPKEA